MNIFFIYLDPREAARHHGDKHVIKMILESVQMLTTCCHILWGCDLSWVDRFKSDLGREPYRKAFANHPCTVWVRQARDNYLWLCDLAEELCLEKERRWGLNKPHVCKPMIAWLRTNVPPFPSVTMTPPNKAMTTERKGDGVSFEDSLDAYRAYYQFKADIGVVRYDQGPWQQPDWLRVPPKKSK